MRRYFLIPVLTVFYICCQRSPEPVMFSYTPFLNVANGWADSMLLDMTLNEKIAQLFIADLDLTDNDSLSQTIFDLQTLKPGGLILEGMPLDSFLNSRDKLQQNTRVPFLVGTKQLTNLNNQFAGLTHFPDERSVEAIRDGAAREQLAEIYQKQFRALALHFSLPEEPAISLEGTYPLNLSPSLDMDVEAAARDSQLAIAGYFDALPLSPADSLLHFDGQLIALKSLVEEGLSGLMISEKLLDNVLLDSFPANYLKDFLKQRFSYEGLIMANLTPQQSVQRILRAGVDVLVTKNNVRQYMDSVRYYLETGALSGYDIEAKTHKILRAKKWLGLDSLSQSKTIETAQLFENPRYDFYVRQLFESGLSLIHNPEEILPFQSIHLQTFRLIEVGESPQMELERSIARYAYVTPYYYTPNDTAGLQSIPNKYSRRATTIIAIDQMPLEYSKHLSFITSVNTLAAQAKVILVNFGAPKNLLFFSEKIAKVQVHESNETTQQLVGQMLFGGLSAKGRLGIPISPQLTADAGLESKVERLKYTMPQDVGIAPHKLVGIDAIMGQAIAEGATPGAQVVLVKDGKVIYDKAFGYHKYDKKEPVLETDLYDIASITKVAATTLAAMKMYEQKQFKMSDRLKDQLPLDNGSRIKNVTFKKLFTHQSGLQANMPIAPYILVKDTAGNVCNEYFCVMPQDSFKVAIADHMFMNGRWQDTIRHKINTLRPRSGRYRYSDVNFNLIQFFIEYRNQKSLDQVVEDWFYRPLNMRRTLFRPLEKFSKEEIAPTAEDKRWRKQLIHGYVHDESEALFGGVGGNAGLFSDANDMAVLFQMLLNGGKYGGEQFLSPATIDYFTSSQYGNHRGLGFDKQSKRGIRACSPKAPTSTFGHTGFTGGCVWADPDNDLILVLLTNRIHPNPYNSKFSRSRVRERIHTVVYDALNTYDPSVLFPPVEEEDLQYSELRAEVR